MHWFFITLIAPILYAVCNHIDKILLEKYFKNVGVGSLLLYSSLLSGLALPVIYFFKPEVINISLMHLIALCTVGLLNILVLWFYLLALKDEEASIVIVFYQLVPAIALILGYYILGETVTKLQLVAMAIIILGTTIIAFEIDDENNFKLRRKTIYLMTAASFFWALGSVLFKAVALEENVWRSFFWEHVTLLLIGLIILVFVKKYRQNFFSSIQNNSKAILSLNIANEIIYIIGNLIFAFSYLLAPIALILLMNSFQPIFVFIIGIFLTIFFPKISVENIYSRHLYQKALAITITGIGAYLLISL